MRNIDVLIAFLVDTPHLLRKGHWPIWYDVGARIQVTETAVSSSRHCLECSGGGGNSRQRLMPVRMQATLGAR